MSTVSLWTRRSPFAEFDDAFAGIVRRSFGPVPRPTVRTAVRPTVRPGGFVPAAELLRDGDDAVVALEIPGVDVGSDVHVEVDRGQLRISGERRSERHDDSATASLREVRYGSFRRTFALPEHVSADAVSASYEAGVLKVRVSGAYTAPEPTAQQIAIATPADSPQAANQPEQTDSVEQADTEQADADRAGVEQQ